MSNGDEGRLGLVRSITAPLGFYVLALLVVEAFLALVITQGNLDSSLKTAGVWAGIGMFVLVIGLVFMLVWFRPKNLIYDKDTLTKEWDYMTQLEYRNPSWRTVGTLKRLIELYDQGGLSTDEFAVKKKELLAGIQATTD